MALFLSTYVNKLDAKGRVSVPAQFRSVLAGQEFHGVVLFRSNAHACLEGVSWETMGDLSARMDAYDFFSSEQDDLATAIFGESVQLAFDGEGRITLPPDLAAYASINDRVAFVGMGQKFQLWSPEEFEKRRDAARARVQAQGLTVPKRGGA